MLSESSQESRLIQGAAETGHVQLQSSVLQVWG